MVSRWSAISAAEVRRRLYRIATCPSRFTTCPAGLEGYSCICSSTNLTRAGFATKRSSSTRRLRLSAITWS